MNFLDLTTAQELIGKKLKVSYHGYANQGGVKTFVLGSIKSEWELAEQDLTADGYANRAEYWKSYFSEQQINESKQKFNLIDDKGNNTFIKKSKYEDCFWVADSDRFVTFEIVDNA